MRVHLKANTGPRPQSLARARVGHFVQVSNGRERFWVRLIATDAEELDGIVWNELVHKEVPYAYGSPIRFKRACVLAHITK